MASDIAELKTLVRQLLQRSSSHAFDEENLTVREVAKLLKVSQATVRNYISARA
jgi:predicted transcriptional regulator